jgi:phospholipid/cholesterol/gamma-HCH transport system substrate-binding protein
MQTKLSSFDQTIKLFASHDSRLAVLERKVGLFALAGLGALILVFVIVAIEQGMFASTTKLRFQTSDVGMIHEGMEVRLNGFKVGKILGLSLKEDSTVEVQFFVDNKYLLHIRHGAKVRLVEQGLFGDGVLEIAPGPKDQPNLAVNELLPFERKFGMGELAHELVDRLKPILDNVQVTTKSLNESDGLINHVKKVAVKYEKVGQDLSTLMAQTQGVIAEENLKLGKALDKSVETVEKAGVAVDKVGVAVDKASVALDKASILIDSFHDVALDVGKVTASSAESIPPMLKDGRVAAADARNIISSAKDAWPIKNMMEPGETKILPMDSYGVTNAQPK